VAAAGAVVAQLSAELAGRRPGWGVRPGSVPRLLLLLQARPAVRGRHSALALIASASCI